MRAALAIVALLVGAAPAAADDEPMAWLGVTYRERPGPAEVEEVHPGSAAASVGLRPGDRIVSIDGVEVFGSLAPIIGAIRVGQRASMLIDRDGRMVRLLPRLRARPTGDELVHLRLVGRDLPELPLVDPNGVPVSPTEWRDRPLVVVIFDARCDPCAASVSQLVDELTAAEVDATVAVWVVAEAEELAALVARVPMPARPRAVGRHLKTALLGGLTVESEGAIAVVDHEGVIRYGAATSSGARACDEAVHVAARAVADWRAAR